MKVLITGSRGFLGRNLLLKLSRVSDVVISTFDRGDSEDNLAERVTNADFIFHLAGENRPKNVKNFQISNVELSKSICNYLSNAKRKTPIVFASSIQAGENTSYGESKKAAEEIFENFALLNKSPVIIYRLPGVFGKWSRPNYNSVVATFCFNIANGLPVDIHDPERVVRLAYVDDVMNDFFIRLSVTNNLISYVEVPIEYQVKLKDLAKQIEAFKLSRQSLVTEQVGSGLVRALYSTYISHLPPEKFAYSLPIHSDSRGVFAEVLKTQGSGQFSFFTAKPGVTRGGHYHDSKTEKFLVLKGAAIFRFRNLLNDRTFELKVSDKNFEVVDTIPGWVHDITNVGKEDLVVWLWANEIYDHHKPDTYPYGV